ncbi:MAG TPA: hypothetical protein VHK01_13710 [Lacipirellulaceae bacterium]|jgi:hypothetical protein|nr:hypothetical protein [Lacipirellulaceae bacterium]
MITPPAEPDIVTPSVKLYPRLAFTTHLARRKNVRALHSLQQRESAPGYNERNAARSDARARLLRMIVENERLRRNEQRPNAS